MDWQKNILLGGMLVVALLLVIEWNKFSEARDAAITAPVDVVIPDQVGLPVIESGDSELPVVTNAEVPEVSLPVLQTRLVTVTTDVLEVVIDSQGGDIVQARLLQHLTKTADKGGEPFTLLTRSGSNLYVAQSGLIGRNGTDTSAGRPTFAVSADHFELGDDDALDVDLVLNQNGVRIVKRYSFSRGDYAIGLGYLINNSTEENWAANFYGQIKRDSHQPLVNATGVQPYLGAALRTEEKNYFKYDFSDMEDEKLSTSIQGGWVAMIQHYFIGAWVPPQDQANNFNLRKLGAQDVYLMGYTSPQIAVAAGQTGEYQTTFYVGPKDQPKLAELAEYLDLTIDYGFLWMLAKPIFKAMQWIHNMVGNWGWSIILLTVLIKLILYPLSAASLRSMGKMRALQPEMQRLKDLYGDDRQKMSQELMNMYKKEKVNPAGGCLPVLLQMPVFISLYWVLLESVEIRHSPWILWLQDLSAKDPYFILPLIMGASMFFMQKMQPAPPDPMQAKIMQIMPIAFTFFFMLFPSGLVLYWTVNNLLSMLQQWYVNRQLAAAKK